VCSAKQRSDYLQRQVLFAKVRGTVKEKKSNTLKMAAVLRKAIICVYKVIQVKDRI